MTTSIEKTWTAVCSAGVVPEYAGVAALLDGGVQVAIFRLPGDRWYALSNWDPCSGAAVLSRGIVGDAGGVPVVASPVYKERFALDSGEWVLAGNEGPRIAHSAPFMTTRDALDRGLEHWKDYRRAFA